MTDELFFWVIRLILMGLIGRKDADKDLFGCILTAVDGGCLGICGFLMAKCTGVIIYIA